MLIVRVVILVLSRLVTVWVTMQKCASSSWLTTMKTWLRKKLLRKLLVLVVRRKLLKLLLLLLKLLQLKLLRLKNQKLNQLNNFTVILIDIKKATLTGSLFCLSAVY